MLSVYLKSIIVYLIIYWALKQIAQNIMSSRTDVNYKEYRGKIKGMYYIFCFIPILRTLVIFVVLFVAFAPKETLDKFLKKN